MDPAKRKLHSIGPENKQLVKPQNKLQKVVGFRCVSRFPSSGKATGWVGITAPK